MLSFCVYSAFLINLKAKVSLNEKEKLTHEFRNLLSEITMNEVASNRDSNSVKTTHLWFCIGTWYKNGNEKYQ